MPFHNHLIMYISRDGWLREMVAKSGRWVASWEDGWLSQGDEWLSLGDGWLSYREMGD
jgi:hypothetical protein